MLPEKFKKVIDKIAGANVVGNWFFIGSVGSELGGMPCSWVPLDIDIAVDESALQEFKRVFGNPQKLEGKSIFFNIDGVLVELCLKPRDYKFFKLIKKKDGVNTISLKDQVERYEQVGSREKSLRIKRFLEKG